MVCLLEKGHTADRVESHEGEGPGADRSSGMKWADSPKAVAEASEMVLSMVTDSSALGKIADGDSGVVAGLSQGKIWIEMSTVSPTISKALAEQVRKTGAEMVDAPVSGSVITLQQGKLSVMVGGHVETFERVKTGTARDCRPKVTHVWRERPALVMKIATNLSLVVQMLAFSEGVLLAEKSGIPR